MKNKILFILLIGVLFFSGPFPPGSWIQSSYVCPGEYRPAGYDSLNHTGYHNINIVPGAFTGLPSYVQQMVGGAHDFGAIDTLGNVYFSGSNEGGQDGFGNQTGTSSGAMVAVTTDNLGNPLPPIQQILMTATNFSFFFCNVLVSTAATGGLVYIAGNTQGSMSGDGTTGAAVQNKFKLIPMPNGDTIVKIQGQYSLVALNTKGQVLTWADGNYNYALGQGNTPVSNAPGYITLPSGYKAYDIASAGIMNWIFLDSSAVKKKIMSFGWQADPAYQGLGSSGTVHTTPQDVTNNSFMSKMTTGGRYVVSGTCNNETTYFICNDGTLWDIGGNANGTIGNGKEPNYATYTPPYDWNQGQNTFNQDTIYNVAPGVTNWVKVLTGFSNCWYVYAQRSNGALYGWGRNKGGAIWNGVIDGDYVNGNIGGSYPNSWDVVWPILITWPAVAIHVQQTTSPYCISNPGASFCNLYSNPSAAPPTVNAGNNQTLSIGTTNTTLSGTATAASTYYINSTVWTQVSGPNNAVIQFPGVITTLIFGLVTGTYHFQLTATDQNLRSTTSDVFVTIGGFDKLNLTKRVNLHP